MSNKSSSELIIHGEVNKSQYEGRLQNLALASFEGLNINAVINFEGVDIPVKYLRNAENEKELDDAIWCAIDAFFAFQDDGESADRYLALSDEERFYYRYCVMEQWEKSVEIDALSYIERFEYLINKIISTNKTVRTVIKFNGNLVNLIITPQIASFWRGRSYLDENFMEFFIMECIQQQCLNGFEIGEIFFQRKSSKYIYPDSALRLLERQLRESNKASTKKPTEA